MQSTTHSIARYFVAVMIFLYPAIILLLPSVDSIGLVLLALGGFWVLYRHGTEPASRDEKLFYFAFSVFFLAALGTTLLGGIDNDGVKKLDKFLHLLLAVPAYIFLRRAGISLPALWYGLVVGTAVAAVTALIEVWGQPPGFRASGATHPIIFGDLSLVMGVMSLAGLGWFASRSRWQIVLPVLAVLCGLLASMLAHARGSWVAIPFLTLVFLWVARNHITARQRWIAVLLLAAVLLAAYLIPATGVKGTVERTVNNISGYFYSEIDDPIRETSIGSRFEMWQAAWQIFQDNPLSGIGWGNYKEHAQLLVDTGVRNPSAAYWGHPHNQFLSALANGGGIAFVAIVLLFVIPIKLFVDARRQGKDPIVSQLSLAGILLLVSFICFGLSEAIFERSLPASFFAFYMAVLFAATKMQLHAARNKPVKRHQSLSVIIIAQDEADRIEPCLQSVAGWADEIIVLDSGSSDDTVEIARRYTDKVFETDWPGYGPQKQRALEKAGCDWVLSIDADERVTPELRHDIDVVLDEYPECTSYRLRWAMVFYGKRLDFGCSVRAPRRLFKREGSSFSKAQVHEHVIPTSGKDGVLEGCLLHESYRNIEHAVDKHARYSWLWASQRFNQGKRANMLDAAMHGLWIFVNMYIFRLGILDGQRGLLMGALHAQYTFNKYAALWALRQGSGQYEVASSDREN